MPAVRAGRAQPVRRPPSPAGVQRREQRQQRRAAPAAGAGHDGSPSSGPAAGRVTAATAPTRPNRAIPSTPRRAVAQAQRARSRRRRPRSGRGCRRSGRSCRACRRADRGVLHRFRRQRDGGVPDRDDGEEAGPTSRRRVRRPRARRRRRAGRPARRGPAAAAGTPGSGGGSRPDFARGPPIRMSPDASGVCHACGVPTSPSPPARPPGDVRRPRCPTSVRVAAIAMGVLAALLLVNAGLLWYGFDATVERIVGRRTASPRTRPAGSCCSPWSPTWSSG